MCNNGSLTTFCMHVFCSCFINSKTARLYVVVTSNTFTSWNAVFMCHFTEVIEHYKTQANDVVSSSLIWFTEYTINSTLKQIIPDKLPPHYRVHFSRAAHSSQIQAEAEFGRRSYLCKYVSWVTVSVNFNHFDDSFRHFIPYSSLDALLSHYK